jgi:hypothetical protein
MKTYIISIKATIIKTFTIEAESIEAAIVEANELFNPYSGEAEEKYEQEVVRVNSQGGALRL